jgi:NAD(P)-dependent dehydrogenase (short-subunit alcohol dehydrogenase family)
VLNGTATTGLGRRAADKLTAAGFQVVNVDNAARRYDKTTVFFKAGFEDVARQIASALGGATVEASPDNLSRDITAIVGADYQG